ncbi:hypothetical protein J6590_100353 [Homalodisca vitripennis]|nr:hypothetical protein J6590_100353 [Homalodisca vitripennis]
MFSISVSCDSAAVYQPQCASRAGRQWQLCGNVAQASPFYWSPPTALSGGSLYKSISTKSGVTRFTNLGIDKVLVWVKISAE